jgi:uncharacterized protein YjiK
MACSQASEPEKSILGFYFNSTDSSRSVTLPKELKEISGLAMTHDGRLFAHNDENSVIYQIDYRNGTILKNFVVGKKKSKKEDFEGLAIVENTFYMVTSEGILFEFKEGEDGKNVKHKTHKTWLSSKYDVEGLCYDSETHALLLACKGYAGKGYSDERAVYVFSLNTKKLEKEPRLLLPKKVFKEDSSFIHTLGDFFLLPVRKFAPSGIERHPKTGTFIIISAKGRSLIEISREGKILGRVVLPSERHKQPEGIAFTPDHHLLISDEGGDSKARITCYPSIKPPE